MFLLTLSTIALVIISVTLFVRAADLGVNNLDKSKAIRLTGFVLGAAMPIPIMLIQWNEGHVISIYDAIFHVGLAGVFMTTPYLPPWWKYISHGNIRQDYHRRSTDRNPTKEQ